MTSYENVIEAAVKKETEILGEEKSIAAANGIEGLKVDDSGNVASSLSDGEKIFSDLVAKYKEFGGSTAEIVIAGAIRDMDLEEIEVPADLEARL